MSNYRFSVPGRSGGNFSSLLQILGLNIDYLQAMFVLFSCPCLCKKEKYSISKDVQLLFFRKFWRCMQFSLYFINTQIYYANFRSLRMTKKDLKQS